MGLCGAFTQAKVQLPAFFSDGMVMQQQATANLWGTATPRKTVTLTTGWDGKTYRATADTQGKWNMSVTTPPAGGPYSLTFSDGELTVLNNILIGELWICSGQSNMEMPMKGYKNQPIEGADMDILRSTNPSLRLFTVKRHSTLLPQYDVTGTWNEAMPTTVREFSATAYYFGRLLNELLDVPVGLIVTAWGGSAAEAWMTVIWYQGEDNTNRPHSYADMFTTLINGWRAAWQQGDFPFYYCQIAPYDYALITAPGQEPVQSALIREAQSQVEHRVPHTGMAVLLDAGMEKGIHPAKKRLAGERLGLLALTKTYGIEGVNGESPYYKSMEIQGDTVIVSFERADMWISGKECFESKLFSVAGEDRIFHPAKAWIVRSKMYVRSEKVPHPVAVRYAFDNYVEGDLFCGGLPLSSFRSDNW